MAFNIWERWPWTSFQNLNLDWLMKAVKEAVTKAEEASASVGQFDARITANTEAIEQLDDDMETISSPVRVVVSTELEARYRGNLVTGAQLLEKIRTHGDLPYVEYNGEIYMPDTPDNTGNLRFSMGHTSGPMNDDLVIRHIMIPAQSSNCAYSISNISSGGGGGSSGNVFAVKITNRGAYADPQYICDHTYAEIYSQMENGRIPVLLVSFSSNPAGYEFCGMGETGTRIINGQSVACVRFSDPTWLITSSNNVGVWTIDANGNVDYMAALKQLAALDNIVDMVNDGVSTNALLSTAQTLSAAQQAQVKQNLGISDSGGSYSPYLIPVTQSGGVYSTTATGENVFDNILDCRIIFNGLYYYPIGSTLSGPYGNAYFACVDPSASGKYDVDIFDVQLNGTSACTVAKYDKDVFLNGAVPYIPISASSSVIPPLQPNTLVEYTGDATTLSITLATPSDNSISNEYHFIFHSGSTPTTLTIPNTVRQPDGFTVEANHVYEVSILNNNMTSQGWEVTP